MAPSGICQTVSMVVLDPCFAGSRSLMILLVTSKSFFSGVLGVSAMSALAWLITEYRATASRVGVVTAHDARRRPQKPNRTATSRRCARPRHSLRPTQQRPQRSRSDAGEAPPLDEPVISPAAL